MLLHNKENHWQNERTTHLDGRQYLQMISDNDVSDKEIKPINPKGNQPWIFIQRTDAEDEASILWPPNGKSWLTGKDLDPAKDWRKKEKRAAEDEMIRQHHQLSGHELEQILGDSEGPGSLTCCSSWDHKKVRHDLATEQQIQNKEWVHSHQYQKNKLIKNGQKTWIDIFPKKIFRWPSGTWKDAQHG